MEFLNTPQGPHKFATILSRDAKQLLAMDRYERRALSRRKSPFEPSTRHVDVRLVVIIEKTTYSSITGRAKPKCSIFSIQVFDLPVRRMISWCRAHCDNRYGLRRARERRSARRVVSHGRYIAFQMAEGRAATVPGDIAAHRTTAAAATTSAGMRRPMVMCSGTTDGRIASKCQGKWTHHAAQRPSGRRNGAGGRHGAPLLRKSRKSVSITVRFIRGIPV